MSDSILEALFNGKIAPWQRKCTYSPERVKLERIIESEKQYFCKKMSSDDLMRFEELQNLFMKAAYDEELDIYLHGFTLASLIATEVMGKKQDIINE